MKFLIPIIFLATLAPLFSQGNNKSKGKTCRLIYLQKPADAPNDAYLYDGTISHKVELPSMNFSNVVTLPGGDLTLGMTPGEVTAPENFPSSAPTVKVSASVTDLYLIVVYDATNKILPIRMLPLDVGISKLKPGQTLWVNFTKHRILGKLGEENLDMSGGAREVSKAPLAKSGYYKALFGYLPKGEKSVLPIMNKSWWHDANSKNLGFIIDSGGRLPRIFTFRDFREPDQEPTENTAGQASDPP